MTNSRAERRNSMRGPGFEHTSTRSPGLESPTPLLHMSTEAPSPIQAARPIAGEFEDPSQQSVLRRELAVLFRRRRLIAGCVAASASIATVYNYGARPLYQAESVISLDVEGASTLQVQAAVDQSRRSVALWEQIAAIKSSELALRVVETADPALRAELSRGPLDTLAGRVRREIQFILGVGGPQSVSIGDQVAALRSRLSVTNEPNSAWVAINLRAYDPTVATSTLNRLVETYVAEVKKQTGNLAETRRTQLQREVETRKDRVSDSLVALKQDDKWRGLQGVESKRQFLEKQIAGLQDALVQARQTRLARRVLLEDQRRLSGRGMLAIAAVRADPEIASLLSRIADLEARQGRALSTLGERHPDVTALKEELALAEAGLGARLLGLRQTVEREYRLAEEEEGSLSRNLAGIEGQLNQLAPQAVEFSLMRKQSDANERAVGELIERSVNEPDAIIFLSPRVVQIAGGPAPLVSPDRSRNFLYSLAIGLGLGVALAWLLKSLDETISTPEQIGTLLDLPCLGMVPRVEAADMSSFFRDGGLNSRLIEAYRVIRTNVTATHQGEGSLFLLLTSTSPGEGKTTTSFGLAVALAATGKRVLLIDGDVRRGTLTQHLGLTNRKGLLDLAAGQASHECRRPSTFAGLDFVPCGRPEAATPEALTSDHFRAAIVDLAGGYRFIVCDAPPVLAVADAAVLCGVADEVILVVRAGKPPAGAVRAAVTQLKAVGARLRGAILNAADLRADSYYYQYYYSGYYNDYSHASQRGRSGKTKKR